MQTQLIDNNLSFGIRYKNKRRWDKETLKVLENSELMKDLDQKYPDATISLRRYREKNSYYVWHTILLEIALTPEKIYKWGLASMNPLGPNIKLAEDLRTLTLSQVEKNATRNNNQIKKNKLKFLSSISEQFSKVFSKQ